MSSSSVPVVSSPSVVSSTIRNGVRWALWSAFLAPVVAVAIALPLHYPYGFDTIGHLGLIYLDALTLLVGTILAHNAISRS